MKYALLLCLMAFPATFAGNWTVDSANAKINFSVKGPFGTVHGSFSGLKATIDFDEKAPSGGSIKASVPVKTVKTGIGKRDRDLCNESTWFDADKFPDITYVSKKIEKTESGFSATGELTMKGVTKPETIPFTFAGNVFKGQFVVNREDFGLGKSGGSVSKEVTITLEVPVKK